MKKNNACPKIEKKLFSGIDDEETRQRRKKPWLYQRKKNSLHLEGSKEFALKIEKKDVLKIE